MPWKFWLGVALLIAFIVGAQIEHNSSSSQAHTAGAWKGAVESLSQDACDAYQRAQQPDLCKRMAEKERPGIQERLKKFQP